MRGPQQVCERYGISDPRQVIDLLALEGDASDNVPGCPGVGEKTAAKLSAQFGSVENLLANTAELKGALKSKIETNADQIRLSKELVTICTDVPVGVDPENLHRQQPDIGALKAIYNELEFRNLIARLEQETPEAKPAIAGTEKSLFDLADDKNGPIHTIDNAVAEDIPPTILDSAAAIAEFADSVRNR